MTGRSGIPVDIEMAVQKGKPITPCTQTCNGPRFHTLSIAFTRIHQATVEKPKQGTVRYRTRRPSSLTSHPVFVAINQGSSA
ncbi:G/U mismatch-specific uracil DNA glycosylase [Fusarium oxysporum f. sp. albedinis]|nr:G/U mismatch-specific uracil DNA glycosylase [Fusarium oxysporum f. sp. albedinis]